MQIKIDIHEQLCALLDREGAHYRVIEHEAEGRTDLIAQIRGNRIEQSIKSIVVQVRLSKKENIYCLANVPGHCRVDLGAIKDHFKADSIGMAQREKAQALTGCVVLQVLADPLIQENAEVVFNAGRLDRSIFMDSADYIRIAKPQLISIALQS
jgi:Ala-tRNA(Pro) deacylase